MEEASSTSSLLFDKCPFGVFLYSVPIRIQPVPEGPGNG